MIRRITLALIRIELGPYPQWQRAWAKWTLDTYVRIAGHGRR